MRVRAERVLRIFHGSCADKAIDFVFDMANAPDILERVVDVRIRYANVQVAGAEAQEPQPEYPVHEYIVTVSFGVNLPCRVRFPASAEPTLQAHLVWLEMPISQAVTYEDYKQPREQNSR